MTDDLRKQAKSLLKPPFNFLHGYIFDASAEMAADTDGELLRVRGWGRLQKLKNGGDVQDAIGALMAEALTKFWLEDDQLDFYKQVVQDYRDITKRIDQVINGDKAADQASLVDLLPQIVDLAQKAHFGEGYKAQCEVLHNVITNLQKRSQRQAVEINRLQQRLGRNP